jgi:hypothetical protein
MSNNKTYLGDSVYATFDGYHIVLTTENGIPDDPSNTIALEPGVLQSLAKYKAECFREQQEPEELLENEQYFAEVIDSNEQWAFGIKKNIRRHGKSYQEVLNNLKEVVLQSASPDSMDLNIRLAGTKQDLETVWRVLRQLGFESPNERPAANQSEYTGRFRRSYDDCSVYLIFASTVCKRVKVGTQTIEQDIYEVRCE